MLRGTFVHPRMGKDGDAEVQPDGEHQHLDVEGEAIELLAGEDRLRGRSPEGLEAALGVRQTVRQPRARAPARGPAVNRAEAPAPEPLRAAE